MKIIIDLQCCQTEARSRGIGRYSLSLAEALTKLGREHEFMFLLNRRYLSTSADLARRIDRFGKLADVVLYDYPSVAFDGPERMLREQIASVLRNDRVETVSPDVYHISSLFEGESVFGQAAAFMSLPKPPILRSATLYDFIPAIYPDRYLEHRTVASAYRRTMSIAKQLDLGLAISETTKRDAQTHLGLAPEKIATIMGSVDDGFRILDPDQARRSPIWRRLDLTQPYLLYIGGADFRKNLEGTLEAFALVNASLEGRYKLAIVFDVRREDEAKLRRTASRLGIADKLVVTGEVSDEELVELYNNCILSVFPTLYEGLGLPAIEAMRCGAPVLVGDNSSLREIVDEPAYRFDASDPRSIAASIERALQGDGELEAMRRFARRRSGDFSWETTARAALDAWDEALDRRKARTSAIVRTPRPRIAMFTPLPPARSGIADYSADFLGVLRNHATVEVFVDDDIAGSPDLDEDVRVFHHAEFPLRATTFDAVVYQLGNSPFHHYMAPYIARYPGVAVLHDAYVGHLSHDPANPAPFVRQVVRDHGGDARKVLDGDGPLERGARALIERLTCVAPHVYRSLGVIVHSAFARDLLAASTRPVISPPIAVVPQYRARIAAERRVGRRVARERLGLPETPLIVGAFGHVAGTKGVLELIEAFDRSRVEQSRTAILLFVGELEGGATAATPFAQEVLRAIEGRADIVITGFVDQTAYDLYLQAVDLAVQLRTLTRGETSRALLDLLWSGTPILYNRLGASSEIPEEVAVALDSYDPDVVAAGIDRLAADPDLRDAYGRIGIAYMEDTRDGDVVAADFLRTVLAMSARSRACGPDTVIRDVARLLPEGPLSRDLVSDIAAAYVRQERSEDMPRLLIDVTHIRENDLGTGVQRVVRQLTRMAYRTDDDRFTPQPFAFTGEGLILADDFARRCGARLAVEEPDLASGTFALRPFDKMLLADGTWHLTHLMQNPIEQLNALGGQAYGMVQDILPFQHPAFFPPHVAEALGAWLRLMATVGEGLICTSRTGADALIDHLDRAPFEPRRGLRIGYVPLGADFAATDETDGTLLPKTKALLARPDVFLIVGTIEPRKGHETALDAFERLWATGEDVVLAIVGKRGWQVDALIERLDRHPERDHRLFLLGPAPDADLAALYRRARATIVPSLAEGFGLPIYEAARMGSPLVLSDLPVFRELAADHARYFRTGSAESLAEAVRSVLRGPAPASSGIVLPTWQDCAARIFDFMAGRNDYHIVGSSALPSRSQVHP